MKKKTLKDGSKYVHLVGNRSPTKEERVYGESLIPVAKEVLKKHARKGLDKKKSNKTQIKKAVYGSYPDTFAGSFVLDNELAEIAATKDLGVLDQNYINDIIKMRVYRSEIEGIPLTDKDRWSSECKDIGELRSRYVNDIYPKYHLSLWSRFVIWLQKHIRFFNKPTTKIDE